MGKISKAIHDIGAAVWFGGTLMGTLAMNPAVEVLDDPEERGKMVDEGWALFQPWAAAGLLGALISHVAIRRGGPKNASGTYKTAAALKDVLMVSAVVSSVASMALGEYAMHQEPDAYTPIEDATTPTEGTSFETAQAQSGLTVASWVQLASGLGIFITNAIMSAEREKVSL
jgi:uncharacterized membrane protein